uniref:Uncharacterized protein n=1 Tax=Minutocellus polymorphus TaxID=265543 RepID=A0A7S0FJV1_9STRA|mmetsp:Transcript_13639/g.22703  ORF Transcript_13639/g.22703 Transcript_13639/m.22703 type:complete len:179 (+) Transcript_13639:110-646(+)
MMCPAFTRLAFKGTRLVLGTRTQILVPTLADGGLRWFGATPATSCRIGGVVPTSGPTPTSASTGTHKQQWQIKAVQVRFLATMPENDLRKRMDEFQDLFVEARLCIEDAQESQETTYFAEDLDAAQEAVDEAVAAFKGIVNDIEDKDQKNSVLRSNGLKVEQLKGELQMIIDGHGHHH